MKLSTFRRLAQGITFGLFLVLFVFTVYPNATKFPLDSFLRLDPLVALVAMVASRAIITTMLFAGILLVLSALFGRFFCGYICPLGTLIDFSDFFILGKKHKRETPDPKPNRRVKYFILIGAIAASLLGANFLGFFSPMSIAPRILTLVIYPPILAFFNGAIDLLRPFLVGIGLDDFTQFDLGILYFATAAVTFLLFAGIVTANFFRKRFWCRYICPTGAFISVFSRFGLLKRHVDESLCNSCKVCAMKCDMRAVASDSVHTIVSECTLCGDCVTACKKNAITIGFMPKKIQGNTMALDVCRRNFLQSAGAGLVLASSVKAGINSYKNVNGRFIRPPGSVPEPEFVARCIRCGECMKVCKTNTLQPAFLESGFDALWTPHLEMRRAPCEKECNMCGHVCPTQAIRALPVEEKKFVRIGTAVIDRSRCIAWEQNKLCLICDEICPFNAIETKVIDDNVTGPFKRPVVTEDKCTGCGYCEKACPIYGRAAIEIFSIGEERKTSGSYITENKKKLRAEMEGNEVQYSADQMGGGGAEKTIPDTTAKARQITPSNKTMPVAPAQEEIPKGFSE